MELYVNAILLEKVNHLLSFALSLNSVVATRAPITQNVMLKLKIVSNTYKYMWTYKSFVLDLNLVSSSLDPRSTRVRGLIEGCIVVTDLGRYL